MKCKFIILLIALVSCSYNNSQSENNITISVNVKKVPEMGFVISYLRGAMKSVEFNTQGHGECVIEDMDAAYLIFHNGFSEQKMIYAEKGDHIQLEFDGESMAKTLKMTGVRQPIADYLAKVNITWPDEKDFTLEIDEFVIKLKERIIENQKLLDSCATNLATVSDKFVKIERNRIKYMLGLSLLDYPRAHAWSKDGYKPGEDYYSALVNWTEEDKDLLCLTEYRTIMSEVPAFIMSHRETIHTPYEKVMKQMEYINSNYKDEQVKQTLLTILACDYTKENGILQSKELDSFIRQHVTNKDLSSQYQKIYNSWAIVSPGQKAPDFKAVDTTGKEYSLKDFKGKYVCLYFWENISPCVTEFAPLKTLRPLFEEKNVALVNLFIDNNQEAWKQSIQDEEIQQGTHLFLGRKKNILQMYHYNSSNMYQFVLIDPDGKIVKLNIPNPSSGKMGDYFKTTIQN